MANAPGGVILEPNERVILATRPLFLWEPLVVLEVVLVVGSLYLFAQSGVGTTRDNPSVQLAYLSYAVLAVAALLLLWSLVRWIPWSRKWFVLTDRRENATWGVLERGARGPRRLPSCFTCPRRPARQRRSLGYP